MQAEFRQLLVSTDVPPPQSIRVAEQLEGWRQGRSRQTRGQEVDEDVRLLVRTSARAVNANARLSCHPRDTTIQSSANEGEKIGLIAFEPDPIIGRW
jgi:hypothetical protein